MLIKKMNPFDISFINESAIVLAKQMIDKFWYIQKVPLFPINKGTFIFKFGKNIFRILILERRKNVIHQSW